MRKKECKKCGDMIAARGHWKHEKHCDGTPKSKKKKNAYSTNRATCNICGAEMSGSMMYKHLRAVHQTHQNYQQHMTKTTNVRRKNKQKSPSDGKTSVVMNTVFANLQIEIDIPRAFRKGCIRIVQD